MTSPKKPITVLLADDHEVVRAGVAYIVNRQPDMAVVAEARDGRQAVDLYQRHRPDVALIDLRMPDLDGVECVIEIRDDDEYAKIVILTTFDAEEDIQLALQAGAKGFLLKDVVESELVQCIRAVAAGQMCVSPAVAAKLAERLQRAQPTAREMDVLKLMAQGKTNREIAAALFIAESTVKLHANNLFAKLGASTRTEAMRIAIKRGLVRISD